MISIPVRASTFLIAGLLVSLTIPHLPVDW
jgi:hypothetical protein